MSVRRPDILLLVSLLCLCICLFFLPKKDGTGVEILSRGRTVGVYPLSADRTLELEGNTVVIRNGRVSVAEADCPGGDCVAHAPISMAGESIVCLPNRLVVRIIGADAPDAVTGGTRR